MTDVICCFQTELVRGEQSSSLRWSSPQGCSSREDVAGAGAKPPAGHPLLQQEHEMHRKWVGLTQTCPSAVGISLIFSLSTRRGMQREGRQRGPAIILLEPLYRDPPLLSAAHRCNAASLPLHTRLISKTLTHAACIRIKKPLNLRKEKL